MIRPHKRSAPYHKQFFGFYFFSSLQASLTAGQLGWSFQTWGLIRHRVNRLLPQESVRATGL